MILLFSPHARAQKTLQQFRFIDLKLATAGLVWGSVGGREIRRFFPPNMTRQHITN